MSLCIIIDEKVRACRLPPGAQGNALLTGLALKVNTIT
jgi:hypothetical protein